MATSLRRSDCGSEAWMVGSTALKAGLTIWSAGLMVWSARLADWSARWMALGRTCQKSSAMLCGRAARARQQGLSADDQDAPTLNRSWDKMRLLVQEVRMLHRNSLYHPF